MRCGPAAAAHVAAGFTLIELMVTISIVAILLALTAPSMVTTVSNASNRGVMEKFSQDYNWLRSRAGSATVTLTLNPDCTWTGLVNGIRDASHSLDAQSPAQATRFGGACAGGANTPLALPAVLSFNGQGFQIGPTGSVTFVASNGQIWPLQVLYSGSIIRLAGAS